MIGNIWFDRATGATTYNIDDPDCRFLTEGAVVCSSQAADGSWSGPRAGRSSVVSDTAFGILFLKRGDKFNRSVEKIALDAK